MDCGPCYVSTVLIIIIPVRYEGFIWNGDLYLLGVQTLAVIVIIIWSCASTFFLLFTIDLICPIRMAEHMELLGADYCEVGGVFCHLVDDDLCCFVLSTTSSTLAVV